ncbi:unnamed protein product [Protopolystoma xenopodis]|uniref:Uncharacterized protein n=1 Tax=Protopolystoma xenopodis TaxID=117903 RepID=A0A448X729_9PLAT|nr:unnamed protein product [Protopolystoma xenopodis]
MCAPVVDLMMVRHAGQFDKDYGNTKMLVKEAGPNSQK